MNVSSSLGKKVIGGVLRKAPIAMRKAYRNRLRRRAIPHADTSCVASAYEEVIRRLEAAHIRYFLGGSEIVGRQRISFLDSDADGAIEIIAEQVRNNVHLRAFTDNGQLLGARDLLGRFHEGHRNFNVGAVLGMGALKAHGRNFLDLHLSCFEVGFWLPPGKSSHAGFLVPSRRHANLGRVAVGKLPRNPEDCEFANTNPHFGVPEFPIDAIYTWVDGSDPDWQERKARYSNSSLSQHASAENRFRDIEELRYSLRSLEQFAPFVRKVFLVTEGHLPKWLNREHPRLEVVSHETIFRNSENLPTFNSSAIESCLHRIPGLAEHHIYLNDDFFFARPNRAEQYFAANGIALVNPGMEKVVPELMEDHPEEYIAADRNAAIAFGERFGFRPKSLMKHVPMPATVSAIRELEREFPTMFETCESNRFRSDCDIRAYAFMFPHYASFRKRAVPGALRYRYVSLGSPYLPEALDQIASTRGFDTFVLNDVLTENSLPRSEVEKLVTTFLSSYFPVKSSFEL